MDRIPKNRLEEHRGQRPRGGRAFLGRCQTVWVDEGGGDLGVVGRGCTVLGLAAILRTQNLSQDRWKLERGDMRRTCLVKSFERASGEGI